MRFRECVGRSRLVASGLWLVSCVVLPACTWMLSSTHNGIASEDTSVASARIVFPFIVQAVSLCACRPNHFVLSSGCACSNCMAHQLTRNTKTTAFGLVLRQPHLPVRGFNLYLLLSYSHIHYAVSDFGHWRPLNGLQVFQFGNQLIDRANLDTSFTCRRLLHLQNLQSG